MDSMMDTSATMTMNMAFTTSYKGVPILFSQWAPADDGAFVGAWVAIFFMAILLRTLFWLRAAFETLWAAYWYGMYPAALSKTKSDGVDSKLQRHPFRLQVEVPRMLLVFVTVMLGYALMLIVMTYVVGYFFAVCTGLAVGELALGRFSHGTSSAELETSATCCV